MTPRGRRPPFQPPAAHKPVDGQHHIAGRAMTSGGAVVEQNRVPKGVRTAGRFAAETRAEPSVTLEPDFQDVLASLSKPAKRKADKPKPTSARPDFSAEGPAPRGTESHREYLGPGTLYDRNKAWTPAAIRKFLPEPDKEVTNPVIHTGPPMRMFLTSRVEEIEATEEWAAWMVTNRSRSASSARRNADREERVHLGHGRSGFYPVVRR